MVVCAKLHSNRDGGDGNSNDDDSSPSSYFKTTVILNDWWLVRAGEGLDGKGLAVAGFDAASIEQGRPVRMFCSAPIVERHNGFTLETSDGITVLIEGFINEDRTIENGFSTEVFNHFLFGFPSNWKACAEKFLEKDDFSTDAQNINDEKDCSSVPESFNVDASKSNVENDNAADPSSVQEESNIGNFSTPLNDNVEGTKEPSICENLCNHGILASSIGTSATLVAASSDKPKNSEKTEMENRELNNLSAMRKHEELTLEAVEHQDKRKPKRPSKTSLSPAKIDIPETRKRAAKLLRSEGKNEQKATRKGSSSTREVLRKIDLDAHECPTEKSKERTFIRSAESLSLKRSRAGRLLLPKLEFWRNQKPLYDEDRNFAGIEEEIFEVNSPSGNKSEPSKRQRRNRSKSRTRTLK